MSEHFAGWVPAGDAVAVADDAPAEFGTASWLPPSVQRAQLAEDRAAAREARDAERARESQSEARHDAALSLYRSRAESRGEVVSAMAMATGQVTGRSLGDVLADAASAAEREDARQASRDRREDVCYIDSEPVIHASRSDGWPDSGYEADRQIQQASDLHRDLIAYQARRSYPRALDAARKAEPFIDRPGRHEPVIYR